MTIEQNPEVTMPPRIPIGPPEGPLIGAKAIFWNEREFRAGWRFLIYLLFVALFTLAGNFLVTFLHLPRHGRESFTATSGLVQEGFGLIAVLAAAAIPARRARSGTRSAESR